MDRAYSQITIKSVNEERRTFTGIATTPEIDRMGDVVNPMGVKAAGDIPLFLYHDSTQTVGRVRLGKPTKAGIPFEAMIPKVIEPGRLKDRVDEAWQMISYGLIKAVSIGFKSVAKAIERMADGGLVFNESEVLELSMVPIGANTGAVITGFKSFDAKLRAASGQTQRGVTSLPASRGNTTKGNTVQTLKELKEARETKGARMGELMELKKSESRRLNADESSEFDALETEVDELDDDIRQKSFEERMATKAAPARGSNSSEGNQSRSGLSFVRKEDPDDAFKGQAFTRFLIAKAMSYIEMKDGNFVNPVEIAKHRWGKTHPNLIQNIKAAVAGGGTDSGEWGAELAAADTRFTGDFVEFLYSMTVFDKLPLRPMPENVHVKGQDGAATGYWVGQSKAIPVSKPEFNDVELQALEVGAICVCSKKLIRNSSPSAELWIRDSIAQASAQRVDMTFLSTTAASAGVSPAGILNGLSALAPSGADAAAIRNDILALYSGFLTGKNASNLALIMTPSLAKAISLMVNALGQTEFTGLNAGGGTLLGDTVYTGDNVTPGDIILLKPSDIWKIGETGVQVSMSDTAMIEQDSAPQGATDTPVAASATLTSMWQTESVAFKAVRNINYQLRRAGAVAVLSNAEYGGVVS